MALAVAVGVIVYGRTHTRTQLGIGMLKSTHALIQELEYRSARIAGMGLTTKIPDGDLKGKLINLANSPADLNRMSGAVDCLVARAGLPLIDAEQALRQLTSKRHFYGTYCELRAYEWFDRHRVAFTAQVPLNGEEVINPTRMDVPLMAGSISPKPTLTSRRLGSRRM
jgi:hypothetical protein